jgi:hypothetical protein
VNIKFYNYTLLRKREGKELINFFFFFLYYTTKREIEGKREDHGCGRSPQRKW